MSNGIIYLLHFEQPIGNARKFAQHYLGYCHRRGLGNRLLIHWTHSDARIMQVVRERGIEFQLVRTWRGSRAEERRLKNIGKGNQLCPLCHPESKRGKKVKPRTKPTVPVMAREEFESLCF